MGGLAANAALQDHSGSILKRIPRVDSYVLVFNHF